MNVQYITKKIGWFLLSVVVALISGCSISKPANYNIDSTMATEDLCHSAQINSLLTTLINKKVGMPGGPNKRIQRLAKLSSDSPGRTTFVNTEHGDSIECYGVAVFEDGSQMKGMAGATRDSSGNAAEGFWHSDQEMAARGEKAAQDAQRVQKCVTDSYVYLTVATLRDARKSPQQAFQSMRPSTPESKIPFVKAVINEVYFDSEFTGETGEQIQQSIMSACINPPPHWKPLE